MSLGPKTYAEALEKARSRPQKPRTPLRSRSPINRSGASTSLKRKSKRKRVATRSALVKRIDKIVFQMICLMYAACVECGSVDKPTTGHVLSRRSFATRWDFRNIFRQCWGCNYKAAMTAAASYHLWYVQKFGVAAFEKLYQDWAKGRKYTRLELENLASEFESKLNALKENQPCALPEAPSHIETADPITLLTS